MFFVGMLSWWYGNGWRQRVGGMSRQLAVTSDYFSISLLLETLFSPFRQISAGSVRGSIGDQARAFLDRTISRFIGAFLRLFMVGIGLIAMLLQVLVNVLIIIVWPIVPVLPIFGLILTVIGLVPSW